MMMFAAHLEARDPSANPWWAWRIEARRDLLGDWTADVIFGRIGGGPLRFLAGAARGHGCGTAARPEALIDLDDTPGPFQPAYAYQAAAVSLVQAGTVFRDC
jgi:hypothetical protein